MSKLSTCCWSPPTDDSESVCSRCHEHATFEEERPLPEVLNELTAALDEPLVIFGGKTTREMLGGKGERA
jgi:hypothetical protein